MVLRISPVSTAEFCESVHLAKGLAHQEALQGLGGEIPYDLVILSTILVITYSLKMSPEGRVESISLSSL